MKDSTSTQTTTIGRRQLLKAIAATGGAVTAASLLPGQWVKPVVEAGLLPAHAQGSALRISNLVARSARSTAAPLGEPEFNVWNITFDFEDPLGNVANDTLLNRLLTFETASLFLSGPEGSLYSFLTNNNGFDGTIQFLLFVPYGSLDDICESSPESLVVQGDAEVVCEGQGNSSRDEGATLKVTITTADGRTSNSLTTFLERLKLLDEP